MKKKLLILCGATILFSSILIGCENTKTTNKTESSESASPENINVSISEDKAKSIALEDAGLQESGVTNLRVKLETDDNRPEYEIEFYVDNKEYEYEIDATDGTIISKDID